ncbi:hypothetical protein TOPH_07392 [Tolypocladium ophioglossoides CBS 100239]|uniref:GH16 domain-containing protein n=1 Tax=Tolypocladium ophioglossoides (strain CBS 100239) TaxID=1163406 RepID=A0A0L0N1R2_TOLOC|nr:hypothetical protein TOPH_07392 [Tolypocladium ophioglossoides CBS 100239]
MRSSASLFAAAGVARIVSGASNVVQPVNDTNCDCFLTNGTEPAYYTKHMFFDFRSLSQYAGVPNTVTNETWTSVGQPSSDYFSSKKWTDVWDLQSWSNSKGHSQGLSGDATVLMVNSANNVYIERNGDEDATSDTFITMRTKRLQAFQTAAEFQAHDSNYQFLSLRMLARTVGDAGAVSGIFTYRSAETLADIQEADIEILTRGPRNKVQYTNQPSYTEHGDEGDNPKATRNATMPRGLEWTDWAVYRLDWTPKRSLWYVDGGEVASIEFQVPRDASGINFNSWSDGGNWSGNMSVGGEAKLQIQWIEMVYNTTDKDVQSQKRMSVGDDDYLGPRERLARRSGDKNCHVVCSIDETTKPGTAAKLWESAAPRVLLGGRMVPLWASAVGMSIWVLVI